MTKRQQIADLFKGKMTTFTEYEAAARTAAGLLGCHEWCEYLPRYMDWVTNSTRMSAHVALYDKDGNTTVSYRKATESTWWWQREAVRLATGVYPPNTDTLREVIETLRIEAYAVHCSNHPDTPEAVCYTPDRAMGTADRQVKLASLAKLIYKLLSYKFGA